MTQVRLVRKPVLPKRQPRHDPVPTQQLPNPNLQLDAASCALLGDDCGVQVRVDLYQRSAKAARLIDMLLTRF